MVFIIFWYIVKRTKGEKNRMVNIGIKKDTREMIVKSETKIGKKSIETRSSETTEVETGMAGTTEAATGMVASQNESGRAIKCSFVGLG